MHRDMLLAPPSSSPANKTRTLSGRSNLGRRPRDRDLAGRAYHYPVATWCRLHAPERREPGAQHLQSPPPFEGIVGDHRPRHARRRIDDCLWRGMAWPVSSDDRASRKRGRQPRRPQSSFCLIIVLGPGARCSILHTPPGASRLVDGWNVLRSRRVVMQESLSALTVPARWGSCDWLRFPAPWQKECDLCRAH